MSLAEMEFVPERKRSRADLQRETRDAALDLVTDLAHGLGVLTLRILQVPVDVAPAGNDRARIAVSRCFGTRPASSGITSATSGCTRAAGAVPADRAFPPRRS
jgi:hypothetical protein